MRCTQARARAPAAEVDPDLGIAEHGLLERGGHRPASAIEVIEGDPAPVAALGGEELALERLDAQRQARIAPDAAEIAELDLIGEARARDAAPERAAEEHARADARQDREEQGGEQDGGERRPERGAPQAEREDARGRAELARLERLGAQRVHHEGPDAARGEGDQQDRIPGAVGQVRRHRHLEDRERDQQELRAARPRVEQLERLRQHREVGEGDQGERAAHEERHPDRHAQREAPVQEPGAAPPGEVVLAPQRDEAEREGGEREGSARDLAGDRERERREPDHRHRRARARERDLRAEAEATHARTGSGATRASWASRRAR